MRMEFATKPIGHYPPHLRHVATLPWHRKFVTAIVTAVFVDNQHGIQRRGQDFDRKFVFWRGTQQRRCQTNFPRKAGTKRGVNKLLKKLRDTGTVDRRSGSGRVSHNCDTHGSDVLTQAVHSAPCSNLYKGPMNGVPQRSPLTLI